MKIKTFDNIDLFVTVKFNCIYLENEIENELFKGDCTLFLQ
jgi:hypothetical protein